MRVRDSRLSTSKRRVRRALRARRGSTFRNAAVRPNMVFLQVVQSRRADGRAVSISRLLGLTFVGCEACWQRVRMPFKPCEAERVLRLSKRTTRLASNPDWAGNG